jgi:hypothetical protein
MEKEPFLTIYFSTLLSFFFCFCFSKKNVLVNDDEKGSSEKHYPGGETNWKAGQSNAGNCSDKVFL